MPLLSVADQQRLPSLPAKPAGGRGDAEDVVRLAALQALAPHPVIRQTRGQAAPVVVLVGGLRAVGDPLPLFVLEVVEGLRQQPAGAGHHALGGRRRGEARRRGEGQEQRRGGAGHGGESERGGAFGVDRPPDAGSAPFARGAPPRFPGMSAGRRVRRVPAPAPADVPHRLRRRLQRGETRRQDRVGRGGRFERRPPPAGRPRPARPARRRRRPRPGAGVAGGPHRPQRSGPVGDGLPVRVAAGTATAAGGPSQLDAVRTWDGGAYDFGLHCVAEAKRRCGTMHPRRLTDSEAKAPFDCTHYRIIYQTFHGMRDVLAPLERTPNACVLPFQWRKLRTARRVLVESCPASALKRHGLPHQNYKQARGGRLERFRLRNRQKILAWLEVRCESHPPPPPRDADRPRRRRAGRGVVRGGRAARGAIVRSGGGAGAPAVPARRADLRLIP